MDSKRRDHELGEWLRAGDPASDGSELTRDDAARIRRRVLAETESPVRFRLTPLAAVSAAAVLAVLVSLPRPQQPIATGVTVVPGVSAQPDRSQQIQFTTEGGTRILWTLNPDLEL